jgi:hypothetical protein
MTFPKIAILFSVEDGQADRVSGLGSILKCSGTISNIGIFIGAGSGV